MNNLELAASLSKQDMLNMRMQGLSPFKPSDVKKFKSGKGITMEEKLERAKVLFEGTNNLGSAFEKDEDISSKIGQTIGYEEVVNKKNTEVDYRNQLKEDLNNSYNSIGKVFNTEDLMSFKKPIIKNNSSISSDTEQIKLEGFNNSKEYLNSFVINLQNPSTQNRLTLYKKLLACLKSEEKYKQNTILLQAYREGVIQAEKAMYNNLQN